MTEQDNDGRREIALITGITGQDGAYLESDHRAAKRDALVTSTGFQTFDHFE